MLLIICSKVTLALLAFAQINLSLSYGSSVSHMEQMALRSLHDKKITTVSEQKK